MLKRLAMSAVVVAVLLTTSGCLRIHETQIPIFARTNGEFIEFLVCEGFDNPDIQVTAGGETVWWVTGIDEVAVGTVFRLGVAPDGSVVLEAFTGPTEGGSIGFAIGPLDGEAQIQPNGVVSTVFRVDELTGTWRSAFDNVEPCPASEFLFEG